MKLSSDVGIPPSTSLVTPKGVLQQMWDELGTYNANDVSNTAPPRFVTNYLTRRIKESYMDIEAAVHISAQKDKLDNLLVCLEHWGGPASVAAYISSEEDIAELEAFLRKNRDGPLARTSLHVVLERSFDQSNKPFYPHNMLRNLAFEQVVGDYFLALDGDLIPGSNTYKDMLDLLYSNTLDNTTSVREMLQRRQLFVLPAFEVFFQKRYEPFFQKDGTKIEGRSTHDGSRTSSLRQGTNVSRDGL